MPSGHVDRSKPLRPLSEYALQTLRYCARTPVVPGYESNPGVWDRLSREGLVEQTERGSYRITEAGRRKLEAP